MSEHVDNVLLEQLRLIREELGDMRSGLTSLETRMEDRFSDLETELHGQRAILIGFGSYIHAIDTRVEKLEDKLGVKG